MRRLLTTLLLILPIVVLGVSSCDDSKVPTEPETSIESSSESAPAFKKGDGGKPQQPKVAFLQRFSESFDGYGYGPVVFGEVLFNDGSAYNATTGQFVAPFAGVYAFEAHIQQGLVNLEVNSSEWQFRNTSKLTIRLNAGDAVWVSSAGSGSPGEPSYIVLNSFSGHLVYAD
jgi:hypothetical protein